jgi:hypothetical protein
MIKVYPENELENPPKELVKFVGFSFKYSQLSLFQTSGNR